MFIGYDRCCITRIALDALSSSVVMPTHCLDSRLCLGQIVGVSNHHQLHSNRDSAVPEIDKVLSGGCGRSGLSSGLICVRPGMRRLGINAVSGEVGRDGGHEFWRL
jgi:hypothetical protein